MEEDDEEDDDEDGRRGEIGEKDAVFGRSFLLLSMSMETNFDFRCNVLKSAAVYFVCTVEKPSIKEG